MKKIMVLNRMQNFAKFTQGDSKLVFSPLTEEVQNFTSEIAGNNSDDIGAFISKDNGLLVWW